MSNILKAIKSAKKYVKYLKSIDSNRLEYANTDFIAGYMAAKKKCDHYFPATKKGFLPCEFCGKNKKIWKH